MAQVTIVGSGIPDPVSDIAGYEVGKLVAKRGHILITGGLEGVMEHSSRGARELGGIVVGILPNEDRNSANPNCNVISNLRFAMSLPPECRGDTQKVDTLPESPKPQSHPRWPD